MKKVINITLGGVVFAVEEDAYAMLSEYLESIREHFKRADDEGEIVDDIELSIAEKLTARKTSKSKAVRLKDVESIIEEMGTIADFEALSDTASESNTTRKGKPAKKLYRDMDDRIIAGVASGIAAYFGIDAVFVRLIFFALLFLNGAGAILYIVLWIVMPAAETRSQKLEMKGEPVTLQQFESMVKEKVPKDAKESASVLRRVLEVPFEFLRTFFDALGKFLRGVGPILRKLLGLLVVFVSVIAIIGLTITATAGHFSVNSGLFELPVRELLTSTEYFVGLLSIYILSLVPALIGISVGAWLLKRSGKFIAPLIGVFALMWIASLFGSAHIASTLVPKYQAYMAQMPTITEEQQLEAFTGIDIRSGDIIEVRKGEAHSISISGKQVSVENRTVEVRGDTLYINDKQDGRVCIGCFNPSVEIVVTTPELDTLEAAHSVRVRLEDAFPTDTFTLRLLYSSKGEVAVDAKRVIVVQTHSSDLVLTGSADTLDAELRYSSELDAAQLSSNRAALELKYSSSADVGELETLSVDATYSSDVEYEGEPEISEDVSDSSRLKKKF